MSKLATFITSVVVLGGISINAPAQTIPLKRPGDTRPDVEKEIQPPKAQPQLTLPPIEELPETPAVPEVLKFKLSGIEFEGNTIYSSEQLSELVKDYLNRFISTADLEKIRLAVTNHYINNGYINSGALIPDQDLQDNILKIKVVEGRLTTINLQNDGRLKQEYIGERISPAPAQPLNIGDLQERLYLLQQNPRIKRINAALGPGAERGESILDIRITEDKPYSLAVEFNNHRPTSVGEKQGEIQFSHLNISGAGDSIELIYNGTEGLNSGSLLYKVPVLANDSTLNIELDYSDSEVVAEEFKSIELESESWSAVAGFSYPMHKTSRDEYLVELELARRHSESYLGQTLMGCADFGGCDVTALRLVQSWLSRGNNEVFSFRHVMSVGINAFNSTVITEEKDTSNELTRDGVISDSRFAAWLLQFQWAKRYLPLGVQSILRTDMQLAFDPLLSMEQFAIGGANTVRGYKENQYIGDNGLIASLEFRLPIFKAGKQELRTMVFIDHGQSWNDGESMDARTLTSAGLGLRYNYTDWVAAQVYWGEDIKEIDNDGSEWQDQGFHVAIRVNAL